MKMNLKLPQLSKPKRFQLHPKIVSLKKKRKMVSKMAKARLLKERAQNAPSVAATMIDDAKTGIEVVKSAVEITIIGRVGADRDPSRDLTLQRIGTMAVGETVTVIAAIIIVRVVITDGTGTVMPLIVTMRGEAMLQAKEKEVAKDALTSTIGIDLMKIVPHMVVPTIRLRSPRSM